MGRMKELNFENPAAKQTLNQRTAKIVFEARKRRPDRFGKPKNKSEKAEFRRQIKLAEETQLKRALAKTQAGTATPEDRAFVLRHAGELNSSPAASTNGGSEDPEIFRVSDLSPKFPCEE